MAASRKLYNALAESFALQLRYCDPDARHVVIELARYVAADLAADNPSFSRSRFLTACGIDPIHH